MLLDPKSHALLLTLHFYCYWVLLLQTFPLSCLQCLNSDAKIFSCNSPELTGWQYSLTVPRPGDCRASPCVAWCHPRFQSLVLTDLQPRKRNGHRVWLEWLGGLGLDITKNLFMGGLRQSWKRVLGGFWIPILGGLQALTGKAMPDWPGLCEVHLQVGAWTTWSSANIFYNSYKAKFC